MFVHFEEREVFAQVDLADAHFSGDAFVDQFDQLVRIEAVCLTEVEEEARIAFFGGKGTAFATFASVAAGGAFVYLLDFVGILVIVDHAVELERDDTLDDVFLVQPFQLTEDLGHQGCDFFFVHLHLFDLVYEVEQLLFADRVSGRHFAFFKFLVDDTFYLADLAFLFDVADGDGDTCLSGTTGTTAAVRIGFHFIGQTVVDDVCQVVYVQAAGCYVGGDQQLDILDAELLHHIVALRLA